MLKIGVNTRLLIKDKLEGIGRFTFEILKRMTVQNPDVEFHFFFDRPYSDEFIFSDNIKAHVLFPQARHPFLYIWYFNFSISKKLKEENIDLFLSPDGYLSLSTKIAQYPVIHDLNFHHRPKDLPFLTRHYYNFFFPKFSKIAQHIFTVSEFSKKDIVDTYGIKEDKITVTYNGHEHINSSNFELQTKAPYLLYVGSIHARKNIDHLIKGFDHYKKTNQNDLKLIIVGSKLFKDKNIHDTYKNASYTSDIQFTGRISDAHLSALYQNASAMINLSYYEGFGIPIIEAFKNDTPVILSDASCFPEIAKDAAYYTKPNDIAEISSTIHHALTDPEGNTKTSLGREYLNLYTWEKSAAIIINKLKSDFNAQKLS